MKLILIGDLYNATHYAGGRKTITLVVVILYFIKLYLPIYFIKLYLPIRY